MDNAGDWLYIVFLAIAGLSSLLGSKKKKERPAPVSRQPDKRIVQPTKEEPEKGFWEIFDDMQQPQPAPKKKQKPVVRKKQNPVSASRPSPFLAVENETHRSEATDSPLLASPEEKTNVPEIELNDPADLRKAVIYAEILNRKY